MAKKQDESKPKNEAKKEAKKDDTKKPNTSDAKEATSFTANGFLQETKEELDKVVWPSRQQLISESLAVVLMVILSTTMIYLVDNFFSWASGQVFK